jgi:hypothetical protein
LNDSIGDAQTFDEACTIKLGVLIILLLNSVKYLLDSLMILGFVGKTTHDVVQDFFGFHRV